MTTSKASSSKKKSKDGDEEGSKKRRQKKKKDPNAPKKAMSGFMFFSQAEREVRMTMILIFLFFSSLLQHTELFILSFFAEHKERKSRYNVHRYRESSWGEMEKHVRYDDLNRNILNLSLKSVKHNKSKID